MLPVIADYVPPTAQEAADNRVDWSPDPARCALLVHDMQEHFVRAYGDRSALIDGVVDRIRSLRAASDALGVPVYFTAQPAAQERRQRGLLQDFWGDGIRTEEDSRIIAPLRPVAEHEHVTKWRYDAFARTDLAARLREAGRDQLLVTGIYAHIGCLTTATSAFMQDIQPFLLADAVADFDAEQHRMALDYAARRCAVVTTTAAVLEALGVPK